MATSIFDKKDYQPREEDLKQALKTSLDSWNHLFNYLKDNYGLIETEWKFYSKNAGWTLRVSNQKNKNIVFLSPNNDYFLVNINMSVKVKDEVLNSNNIKEVNKKSLNEAKVYMEGTSLLLTVKNEEDLDDIKNILSIRDN